VVPAQAQGIAGPARVIDGDTLRIDDIKIRLHAIDAPERRQTCLVGEMEVACGRQASRFLERLIAGRAVTCTALDRDRYGRTIARCSVAGQDIGRAMVRAGWALAWRRFGDDYVEDESHASRNRLGLWADGDGFLAPWAWRQSRAEIPPDPACAIKGNVSANGRIYHLPDSPDYHRTRIDPGKGERWFCSETDAEAAGWRRPRG
jgi:endonuclease YncB( thermonuclease family)